MQIELAGPADEGVLRDALRRIIDRNLAFCLMVSDGISERIFYFAIGGMRVIASGPRTSPNVGDDLLERGALSQADFDRVMRSVGGDDRRFAEAAVDLGACSPEVVQEALVQQVEHELLDLFFWEGAEVSLAEGHPPKSFYEGRFQTAALTCDIAGLLRGVLERVDVWRQTVSRLPHTREVYEATDRAGAEAQGRYGRLLEHLDGTRTSGDAIERSGLRRVPAFEYLMLALQQGKVRRTVGSAAQRVTREQLLKDIEQLEEALRSRVDASIVRRRLARTLEQAGEPSRAAAQWRELGDEARKLSDLDKALEHYGDCVRVLPTDFATRELIIEIHRHREEYPKVVFHGRPLADLFLKHNLLNRAKQLLLQLVGLEPADVGLRRQLVLVLIGLGERELALKHLRELAKLLESRGAGQAELRDVYVRILALDPRDKGARKRLEQITGVATQRRVLRITAGVTAAGVLAMGAFFWLESAARSAVNEAIADARLLLVTKDVAGARSRLQRVVDEHPMARATRSAQAFLAQIERVQREQAERATRRAEAAGRGADTAEFLQRRERAESVAADLAQEAERLVAAGRLEDAHRVLKELVTAHYGTRAATAAKVPLTLRVLPSDARVIVGGAVVGQGVARIDYIPAATTVIEIERDGYDRERVALDGLQPAEMTVSLHRPVRWTATFDAAIEAPPLVDSGVVYVAGRDRFLTALAVSDGATLWRVPLGMYGDVAATPVLADGTVVVGTASGEGVGVNAATGAVVWRSAAGQAIERVTASAGTVLLGSADGSAAALAHADGAPRWRAPTKTLASGSPIPFLGRQFVWIDARGTLQACDAVSGKVEPRTPPAAVLRGTPAPATDDRLWAFAEDDSLRLVAADSGTALRRFPVPRGFTEPQPAIAGDAAYVSAHDGNVAGFRAGGETLFRKRLEQPAPLGVTVAGGRVYAGGAGGRLSVLDATTGEEIWRFDAGARISSRPTVADGTVYVATSRGELIALQE